MNLLEISTFTLNNLSISRLNKIISRGDIHQHSLRMALFSSKMLTSNRSLSGLLHTHLTQKNLGRFLVSSVILSLYAHQSSQIYIDCQNLKLRYRKRNIFHYQMLWHLIPQESKEWQILSCFRFFIKFNNL